MREDAQLHTERGLTRIVFATKMSNEPFSLGWNTTCATCRIAFSVVPTIRYNEAQSKPWPNWIEHMSTEAILKAALKLPPRSRARLAGRLLDSLDEPVWDDAIVAGAKVAEVRLRRLHSGKTKGVPREKANRQLFDKKTVIYPYALAKR
jgi:hypothetical protein